MKLTTAILLMTMIIFKIPTLAAEESPKNKDEAFAALQGAISEIKNHYKHRPASEKEVIESIRKNINRLDDGLKPENISNTYLSSLSNNATLLYNAARAS